MTPDQHPTIRLFYALNALDIMLGNTNNFHRLVDDRAEHDEQVRKIRDFGLSVWNADKKRSGAVPKELVEPKERSYPYESEAMIDSLKSVLENGEKAVESALDALRMGGGDVLDTALNPGASNQTIHLRTKLDEAQSLFGVMKTTLTMPNVSLDSGARKMDDLASWFQKKSRELGAIVEQHGCDRKPPGTQNTDDLRSAKWFKEATNEGIYPDLLRVAVSEGRLYGSQKVGSRWHHSTESVAGLYPEYRTQIENARAKESTA